MLPFENTGGEKDMRTIEVIAVIIRHEAKYLLTLKDKWGVYNVPSTKTREGETLEQAAQRVLLQDLAGC